MCWLIAAAIIAINAGTAYQTLTPFLPQAWWLHIGGRSPPLPPPAAAAARLVPPRLLRAAASAPQFCPALQQMRSAAGHPLRHLAPDTCRAPAPPPLPAVSTVFWAVVSAYVGFLAYLILTPEGAEQLAAAVSRSVSRWSLHRGSPAASSYASLAGSQAEPAGSALPPSPLDQPQTQPQAQLQAPRAKVLAAAAGGGANGAAPIGAAAGRGGE